MFPTFQIASVQSAVTSEGATVAVEPARADTFTRQGFSLSAIMRGADIEVQWSLYLEDHLRLLPSCDKYHLLLFWPCYTDSVGSGLLR